MFIFCALFGMTMLSHARMQEKLLGLSKDNPFDYDLGIKILSSKKPSEQVTICCHGYGHNYRIVDVIHSYQVLPGNLIGFNFPDYDIRSDAEHSAAAYGTLKEILPLLYILKRCVIDLQLPSINLYGFSAGGGAIINMLVALYTSRYDAELEQFGISVNVKKQLLHALQQGYIILDCPLKSIEEIMTLRGKSLNFEQLASNFVKNNTRPIDSLNKLSGISLNILLHFQNPDEILGNSDDALFIERLRIAHTGKTMVVIGSDGGHNTFHASLWKAYKKLKNTL